MVSDWLWPDEKRSAPGPRLLLIIRAIRKIAMHEHIAAMMRVGASLRLGVLFGLDFCMFAVSAVLYQNVLLLIMAYIQLG